MLLQFAKDAEAHAESRNYVKALEAVEEILKIAPNDEKTLLFKVQILLMLGKLRDADKTINLVVKLYPGNCYAHLTKAIVTALYTTNIPEAISHVDRGLEINPGCFELIIAKAQMLYWIQEPSYNLWIQQASRIDSVRTDNFLKKYWIEKPPTPLAHITAQINGLIQNLMFVISQQQYGGWK